MMSQNQAASSKSSTGLRANSLGLTKTTLSTLLDKLDALTAGETTTKRSLSRLAFRHESVQLHIIHPGGSEAAVRVASRNLSRGGMSLLHSAYIHPGSNCRVDLPTPSGTVRAVHGKIARCIHRGGVLHELGIKFDQHVDLRQFVRADPFNSVFSFENVKPESLSGTLVMCAQTTLDEQMFKHSMRQTSLKVVTARTPDEALARVREACDVLVIDTGATGEFASAVTAKMIDAGVFVPIVVITSGQGQQIRAQLVDVNASIVLTKPVQPLTLWRSFAELGISGGAGNGSAGGQSTAGADQIARVRAIANELRTGLSAHQFDELAKISGELRGLARSFQWDGLAQRIAELDMAIRAKGGEDELVATVCELADLCDKTPEAWASQAG
jgi:CheY-like chemotaxis protein